MYVERLRPIRYKVLALCVITLFVCGCSAKGPKASATITEIPPSNESVLKSVIIDAFARVPLPSAPADTIAVMCMGDSADVAMVNGIISEYVNRNGYRVADSDGHVPVVSVTIDSLAVTVYDRTSLYGRHSIQRNASIYLHVRIDSSSDIIRSYTVSGLYEDTVAPDYSDNVTMRQPSYVSVVTTSHPMRLYLKPVSFAIVMTAIVWSLYSYRG